MAGIGFALGRMTQGRTLSGVAGAYLGAALLVAGPWIFIVMGIGGIGFAACPSNDCVGLPVFRSVVIYNSLISALISGPLALVCTRYVADRIWAGHSGGMTFAYVAVLALFAGVALVVAGPLYGWGSELTALEGLAGVQNLLLMGAAWLLIPFLGAMRRHAAVSFAFAVGSSLTMLAVFLKPDDSPGYLLGLFNIGLAATDFVLLGGLVMTGGIALVPDKELVRTAIIYWELPFIGIFVTLGLWIDKVVMWIAAPEGIAVAAGAFRTMPDYDTPMFWAQLPAITVLAVFFVHIEPTFVGLTRAFYGSVAEGVGRRDLVAMKLRIAAFVMTGLGGLFLGLATVAAIAILASFVAIEPFGLRVSQMAILRIGLAGMVFQTCATFCLIFMLYFDLRRQALIVAFTFFVLNLAFTVALLPLGFPFYGYGAFLAAVVTFLAAIIILAKELRWLEFHLFITNNRSVSAKI